MYASSRPYFASLSTSTSHSNAPILVLNANDPVMKKSLASFDAGYLNPNQADKNIMGRNYFTIDTAYGAEPTQLYASRSCAGGNDEKTLPPAGFVGHKPTANETTQNSTLKRTPLQHPSGVGNEPNGSSKIISKQTGSTVADKFFQATVPVQVQQNPMNSTDIPFQGVAQGNSVSVLSSGQILIKGQGLTSVNGTKFWIKHTGEMCTSKPSKSPVCFFPKSGKGKQTVALDRIIMHPDGRFQMVDTDEQTIPLMFSSQSRPLARPIPGSYAVMEDNASFSIMAPGGEFLYNVI